MKNIEFRLYLGRAIPNSGGQTVSDSDLERFVNNVVTPMFPSGFTIQDAVGAWRDFDSHETIREKTTVLVIVGPEGFRAQIEDIARTYCDRFHQNAALLTAHAVDLTFISN